MRTSPSAMTTIWRVSVFMRAVLALREEREECLALGLHGSRRGRGCGRGARRAAAGSGGDFEVDVVVVAVVLDHVGICPAAAVVLGARRQRVGIQAARHAGEDAVPGPVGGPFSLGGVAAAVGQPVALVA